MAIINFYRSDFEITLKFYKHFVTSLNYLIMSNLTTLFLALIDELSTVQITLKEFFYLPLPSHAQHSLNLMNCTVVSSISLKINHFMVEWSDFFHYNSMK